MASAPTPAEIEYFEAHASDNLQPNMIVSLVVCYVVVIGGVGLRLLARFRSRQPILSDDWFAIVAAVPILVMLANNTVLTSLGLGRHIIFVTNPPLYAKLWICAIIYYCFGIVLVKVSILRFYQRLFPSKTLKWLSWITIVLTFAYNLALLLTSVLSCIPLSVFWDGGKGTCINTASAYMTLSVVNVVTDAWILLLPVPLVWQLKMATARKLQVIGILALGSLVCVFGILRSIALTQVTGADLSWEGLYGTLWSDVEVCIGLLCACLPTFSPLFRARRRQNSYQLSDYARNGTAELRSGMRKPNAQHGSSVGQSLSEREEDTYPMWVKSGAVAHNASIKTTDNPSNDIQITTRVEQSVTDAEKGERRPMQRM